MVGEYPLLRTKGALRAAGAAAVGGLGNAWAAARRGRRPRRACAFHYHVPYLTETRPEVLSIMYSCRPKKRNK
jgi:hypothetical protein